MLHCFHDTTLQCFIVLTVWCFNDLMHQHSKNPMLQCFRNTLFHQHSNSSILQLNNTSTILCFNASTYQQLNASMLKWLRTHKEFLASELQCLILKCKITSLILICSASMLQNLAPAQIASIFQILIKILQHAHVLWSGCPPVRPLTSSSQPWDHAADTALFNPLMWWERSKQSAILVLDCAPSSLTYTRHSHTHRALTTPYNVHCKKGLAVFPSPAGMLLTKLSLAGNNLPSPSPRKVWSKQIQESRIFFTVYHTELASFPKNNQWFFFLFIYVIQMHACPPSTQIF